MEKKELEKVIETIKPILEDSTTYTAHNGNFCYRSFGGLDYYFLICARLAIYPRPVVSGLSYEASNDILELDWCEHDIILHFKEIFCRSLFSGWKNLEKKQAKKWAASLFNGCNCGKEKAIKFINKRILGASLEILGVV